VRRIRVSHESPEERLDKLLAERRSEIEAQTERWEAAIRDLERREALLRDSRDSLERLLRLGTNDLDAREAELVQLIRELTLREERLQVDEAALARRREELGAVELKRAALERREQALAEREAEVERGNAAASDGDAGAASAEPASLLAFVPGPEYSLREIEHAPVRAGAVLKLGGEEYVVARTGPSPLPGDPRRCAYLVRGARGVSPSDGSS
jgi:hypothetical protein